MALAYTYYPGCSVSATSLWYGRSLEAVAAALDVELHELEDWNCCGATAYMSVRELMSFCISARNLALAQQFGRDIVTPCSACFTVLHKTNRYFEEEPEIRDKINKALAAAGLEYTGGVRARHFLDVFVNDVGLDVISERVKRSLGGLKVAAYHGCQIVRPDTGLDSPDYPVILDQLLASLGAEPTDFAMTARCCGSSLMASREDAALDLIADILKCAADSGAEALATVCPMCHINLETQMARINKDYGFDFQFPVLFFSQLMGVALGVDQAQLGLDKSFIDPRPVLRRYGAGMPA